VGPACGSSVERASPSAVNAAARPPTRAVMSDALVEATADQISPDAVTFASLPLLLACLVFLALPADARGRASCVCRAWRDLLTQPSLWTRLTMSDVSRADWQCHLILHVRAASFATWSSRSCLPRRTCCCRC
jgi:hypothetical protein